MKHKLEIPTSGSPVPDFNDFNTPGAYYGPGSTFISSGKFSRNFTLAGSTYVTQSIASLIAGKSYQVNFEISEFDLSPNGYVYVSLGSPTPTSAASTSGSGFLTTTGEYSLTLKPANAPETNNLYIYMGAYNGNQTITLENISLILLSDSSASFAASASIKDIDIVSSGYLFISGARHTYVSGAFSYYVPEI